LESKSVQFEAVF